ncbi:MAG: hypothetical protein RL625_1178 [Gemmatimonadota bacterium]|jgi:hypothetical protein
MPTRRLEVDGRSWEVYPSGYITQSTADEFGLLFLQGTGAEREVRVTRYAPVGVKSREQSLAMLSDAELLRLFTLSQPSPRSPEAGYAP